MKPTLKKYNISKNKENQYYSFNKCNDFNELNNLQENSVADRFVPIRQSDELAEYYSKIYCNEKLKPTKLKNTKNNNNINIYPELIKASNNIFCQNKILKYAKDLNKKYQDAYTIEEIYEKAKEIYLAQEENTLRYISNIPERVLDAPNVNDDYYLNTLDWNKNEILAISLTNTTYLWNKKTNQSYSLSTLPLSEPESKYFCSNSWLQDNSCQILANSDSDGKVYIWDCSKPAPVRTMQSSLYRVPCLAWNYPLLAAGNFNGTITLLDVRKKDPIVKIICGHSSEVCGLKWSLSINYDLASGGNDNSVKIWDIRNTDKNKLTLNEHKGAVRAMAWSPHHRNFLATGGGLNDKTIKFFKTDVIGSNLNCTLHTSSQVTKILWSCKEKELISAHGYPKNNIKFWKFPSLKEIVSLNGHSKRVLDIATNEENNYLLSISADETLKLWRISDYESYSKRNSCENNDFF